MTDIATTSGTSDAPVLIAARAHIERARSLFVQKILPFVVFGLALLAVVAEFTAGAAGKETGLASRILEASFRTEIPEMFAGLVLVSLTGIMIYLVFTWVSKLVLGKWHESEIKSSRQEPGRISQSNSHHEI